MAAVEARAFVFPHADRPAASDIVVVLGGNEYNGRLRRAMQLLLEFPGSTLLVSLHHERYCPRTAPGSVRIVCFRPKPFSTRGEARCAANYARAHDKQSIAVVVTADQMIRARLRFKRCWSGELRMVKSPASFASVLKQLPYQSAASVKALVWQRGC